MSAADRRLLDLFGVELPIVLAPMANFAGLDMAVAVAEAGGLGSLPRSRRTRSATASPRSGRGPANPSMSIFSVIPRPGRTSIGTAPG